MKNKTDVFAPQFIEAILHSTNWETTPEVILNIRKFQKLVQDLDSDFNFQFGYTDLLAFSKRFSSQQMIVVKEMEIHLNSCATQLQAHFQWYNSMFKQIDDINKIISSWNKIKG